MAGQGARRLLRLDWFEWVVLVGVAFVSMIVLGGLLAGGRILTGADGVYPVDQLQYLTWIRQASEHFLIGNEFDMSGDRRVFLHPGFLLSGMLNRYLGVPLQAAYAGLWKPVSVAVVFIGALAYTRRLLPAGWPARVGLVLAIFAIAPWSAFLEWSSVASTLTIFRFDFFGWEMWPGTYLQGYAMTAIAVFMVPLVLLAAERARGGSNRHLAAASAGALVIMWLQPWQGAEMLLIVALVELWRWWRQGIAPSPRLLALFVLGAMPAFYYLILARTDPSWGLAGTANASSSNPLWGFPLWVVIPSLLLWAVPAAFALRAKGNDWQQLAVRFWPLSVMVVFLLPVGTFPFHSIQGLTIPLAVLAVQGMTTFRPGWVPRPTAIWVVPVVIVLVVPGTIHRTWNSWRSEQRLAFPWHIESGDRDALRFLEVDPRPGAVFAGAWSGPLIPAETGREVYVGTESWTPDFDKRSIVATWVMSGKVGKKRLRPDQVQNFMRGIGARFIFQPCRSPAVDFGPAEGLGRRLFDKDLGPLLEERREFGCARVYVLRPTPASEQVGREVGRGDG